MDVRRIFVFLILIWCCWCSRLPLEVFQHHSTEHHLHHHRPGHGGGNGNGNAGTGITFHRKRNFDIGTIKILYQIGRSDNDLPKCSLKAVCNKVDMYDTPWIEKQCRCQDGKNCPLDLQPDDGYTLSDKTRLYKLCEPVKKIPKCRFFRDTTWTINLYTNNVTEQIVHCHCPKNSITYLTKRQALHTAKGEVAFKYLFACSPQARLRCQRKEPCRLFTVRKRQEFIDEVNVNSLCQCPHAHRCPHHHTDYGVIIGKSYTEEAIKTYSGYCLPS